MSNPLERNLIIILVPIVLGISQFLYWLNPLKPILAFTLSSLIGYAIIRFKKDDLEWLKNKSAQLAASFLSGFIVLSALLYVLIILFQNKLILTSFNVSLVLACLAVFTTTLSGMIKRYTLTIPVFSTTSIRSHLPFLCFAAVSFIPYFFNRYAQDNDLFLTHTLAIYDGSEISLASLRPIFPTIQAFYSLAIGKSPLQTYALLPIILFISGVLLFWNFTGRKTLTLLSVLIAPVILTEMYITRPQVILLAFVLPLFIVVRTSLNLKSTNYALTGLLISIILILFHELAVVFFLSFLAYLAYQLWIAAFKEKIISPRQIVLVIIIAFPYLLLLHANTIFTRLIQVVIFALKSITSLSWEWWFVDSYVSVDGAQLGWPGIQAVYYYLYNGIQLLGLLILVYTIYRRSVKTKLFQLFSITTVIITSFFFFFAEIAPRFGFTFLLNRAWPYISLGLVFLLAEIMVINKRYNLAISISYCILAIVGTLGIIHVASDNVAQVFPEESAGISFIRNQTPQASIIISNQPNTTLVKVYGERRFSLLSKDQTALLEDPKALRQIFIPTLKEEAVSKIENQIISETYQNGILVNTQIVSRVDVTPKNIDPPSAIYYLYSKRKAKGLNADREKQYSSNGVLENQLVINPSLYETVYEDTAVIILKIL